MADDSGGILGLERLIKERWEALEADFQAHYQIDLAEAIWRDNLTCRRFGVLLRGLPPSALVRWETNGGWSSTDHLLADLIEAVDSVRGAVIATVTTKPGARLNMPDPFRYPRPGAKPKPKSRWGDLARRLRGGD